jgi:Holliday junction resolvase
MTPEAKVKASVVKLLKKHEVYYFFPATHGFGRSGVPDIVCCMNGIFVAIECKAGKGKTTALQDREIKRIRENKGIAFVVNEENIHVFEAYLLGEEDDDRC